MTNSFGWLRCPMGFNGVAKAINDPTQTTLSWKPASKRAPGSTIKIKRHAENRALPTKFFLSAIMPMKANVVIRQALTDEYAIPVMQT